EDWGYPDELKHGHRRIYGRDVVQMMKQILPKIIILQTEDEDPVTKVRDIAFILSFSRQTADHCLQKLARASLFSLLVVALLV
ncbi:MAG: hypothetical protein ACE5Q3_05375, partial [Alphaproteobacteria bacterium]